MLKIITPILFVILFLTTSVKTFGQELLSELPTTKEEFIASEKNVLATIDWLETTPVDQEEEKRTKKKALLLAWLTNSPTVTIEINSNVVPFTDKNPELLFTFMGGWTKYCLQNNYSNDKIKGSLAGIKSAIKVYKSSKLKKDKEMEKLIELDNLGELEDWIKENINKKIIEYYYC